MLLESLEVWNLRNLQGEIPFGQTLNILAGENGQGKTNLLEAIYLLATTKSFRTSRLQEAIKFGEDSTFVRGRVRKSSEIEHLLQVTIQGNTKTLTVNGKREPLTRYLSELNAVVFNADSLEIVRGAPDARRRFLDNGIVGIYPAYVQTLADYNRVIAQKNSLLQTAHEKEFSLEKTAELLAPWNEQLIEHATRIQKARERFIERLRENLQTKLFGAEEISVRYVSSLEGKGNLREYAALLAERLKLRVQAELIAGRALIGPHRDDLEILFDGHDLRKFGSAGQQRSALLNLMIANLGVYFAQNNEYPLFLIDDIDAELDYKRIAPLLEFLRDKTQTFATTSKESFVKEFGRDANLFSVSKGIATFRNSQSASR
jgi:DNA replication and repair protein RecF